MTRTYEDPRKTLMRERCEIAIDSAGYTLRTPVSIPFSAGSPLQGAIVGDLQALDVDGVVHVYYLRPETTKPLPQWLSNLAIEARKIERVRLYVIVEASSPVLDKTCRAAGAGLLRLDENGLFEIVVDIGEADVAAQQESFRKQLAGIRRKLENKLDLNVDEVKSNFGTVARITAGMPEKKRENYLKDVERQLERWRGWGERMSAQLDETLASGDPAALSRIDEEIDKGPE
jgi:hypothetical protein